MNNWYVNIEVGGRTFSAPVNGLLTLAARDGARYTLDAMEEVSSDRRIEVSRENGHLVVEVDGQPVLVIEGFFAAATDVSFSLAQMSQSEIITSQSDPDDGVLWTSVATRDDEGLATTDWLALGLFAGGLGAAIVDRDDDSSDPSTFVPQPAPSVEIPPPVIDGLVRDTGVADDLITSDPTLILSNLVDDASVRYSLDGGETYSEWFTSVAAMNAALVEDSTLQDGEVILYIQQQSALGVLSEPADIVFTLDTTSPSLALNLPIELDNTLNAAEASSVTISGTSDEIGAVVSITLSDGEFTFTATAVVQSDNTWQTAVLDLSDFEDGDYTVTASVTDIAGNEHSRAQVVTLDTNPPSLTLNVPIEVDDVINASEAPSVTISGLSDQKGALISVTLSNGISTLTATAVVQSDGTWQAAGINLAEFEDGEYTVTASVTDAAGNPYSESHVVTLDTTVADLGVSFANGIGDGFVFDPSLAVVNIEPGAELRYTLDGVNYSSWYANVEALNSALRSDPDIASARSHTIGVQQRDAAGNISRPAEVSFEWVEPGVQVVVFDLTAGTSSSIGGVRQFQSDVEYFIYVVVDADNPQLQELALDQQWGGAENLGVDDRIVLLSDTGQPVLLNQSTELDNVGYLGGRNSAALWTYRADGYKGAFLKPDGSFGRTYSNVTSVADLWTGTADFFNNIPSRGLNEHWVAPTNPGFSEQGIDPATDSPDAGRWNVEFSTDQVNWVDSFSLLSFPGEPGEQTFFVRLVYPELLGQFSPALAYTYDNSPPPGTDIVVFDLENLKSSTGSDADRIFDKNTEYTIFIVVDDGGEKLDLASFTDDGSFAWSGAANLGSDDRIILIADGGGPIIGKSDGHLPEIDIVASVEFRSAVNDPGYRWGGQATRAALLRTDGLFFRYTKDGNRSSIQLFDSLPNAQFDGNPEAGFSNGLGGNTIWWNKEDNSLEFDFLEQLPFDDPNVTLEFALATKPTNWVSAAGLAALLDPDVEVAEITPLDFAGDLLIRMVHEGLPGQFDQYIRLDDVQVQDPLAAEATAQATVVFDLVSGTSTSHEGARSFEAGITYTIFIVVEDESESTAFDEANNQWAGGGNLGSDDQVILISNDGGEIQGLNNSKISSVTQLGNYVNWATPISTGLAASLSSSGLFVRAHDSKYGSAHDLWDGNLSVPANAPQFLHSQQTDLYNAFIAQLA